MCPHDGLPMIKKTHADVIRYIQGLQNGTKIALCAQVRQDFSDPTELKDFV